MRRVRGNAPTPFAGERGPHLWDLAGSEGVRLGRLRLREDFLRGASSSAFLVLHDMRVVVPPLKMCPSPNCHQPCDTGLGEDQIPGALSRSDRSWPGPIGPQVPWGHPSPGLSFQEQFPSDPTAAPVIPPFGAHALEPRRSERPRLRLELQRQSRALGGGEHQHNPPSGSLPPSPEPAGTLPGRGLRGGERPAPTELTGSSIKTNNNHSSGARLSPAGVRRSLPSAPAGGGPCYWSPRTAERLERKEFRPRGSQTCS